MPTESEPMFAGYAECYKSFRYRAMIFCVVGIPFALAVALVFIDIYIKLTS